MIFVVKNMPLPVFRESAANVIKFIISIVWSARGVMRTEKF